MEIEGDAMGLHGIPISAIDQSWYRERPRFSRPVDADHLDLIAGLEDSPKRIPHKYFYDESGTRWASRILELPEFYPTRCEEEILRTQAADILKACGNPASLNIVDLGASDVRKAQHLIRAAGEFAKQLVYQPVSHSEEALQLARAQMEKAFPELDVRPEIMDLGGDFDDLTPIKGATNLVLFLGSTIGTHSPNEQLEVFRHLRAHLRRGDFLLTGFDLKKDSWILQRAYDDKCGITREFNLNVLRRLAREFDADIDEMKFRHSAVFNPGTGAMESWLVSLEDQVIEIPRLDLTVDLKKFERIHVGTAWKFSEDEIDHLAEASGFHAWHRFSDAKCWFVNDLWTC